MKTCLLVLACILVACSQPQPSPVDDGPRADVVISPPSPPASRTFARTRRTHGPVVAPKPDPRTPGELAQAACQGAGGSWRCPKLARKTILAASASQPILPASWSVPNWYVDPANSTGCASDSNSGTSATCGAAGIGPLKSYGELIVHRWGTSAPILPQTVTWNAMSDSTAGVDNISIAPFMAPGVEFDIIGTYQQVGASFVLGTVTAKNRSSGTLLQVASMPVAAAAGLIVHNTTHVSRAYIDSMVSSTATMCQPFGPLATPDAFLSEVDTWATGDSAVLEQPTKINLLSFRPTTLGYGTGFSGGQFNILGVWVPDPSGSPGRATAWVQASGPGNVFDTRVDATPELESADDLGTYYWNGFFNPAAGIGAYYSTGTNVIGGVIPRCTLLGHNIIFDGDVITSGTILSNAVQVSLGLVYMANTMTVRQQAMLDKPFFSACALWGPGSVNVQDGARFDKVNVVSTYASAILLTGSLQLDGSTTASKYAAGTWTSGVSITAANIDSNGGLVQVPSMSRFIAAD